MNYIKTNLAFVELFYVIKVIIKEYIWLEFVFLCMDLYFTPWDKYENPSSFNKVFSISSLRTKEKDNL